MADTSDTGVNTEGSIEMEAPSIAEMKDMARRIRRQIVTMIGRAGSGHPGGSLSAVEVIATLYFQEMKHDPKRPDWPERDRFVLSKGHAAPALYTVLAECGYLPVEELATLRKINSRLQGHADRTRIAGIEMSTGSLGQGLSFSVGMALAGRLDGKPYRVYTLLGDGECDEGQVWEAAMSAAHFKLDNLVAIIDRNDMQIGGWTCDVMDLEPFKEKWQAFGWHTIYADGHDFTSLTDSFAQARLEKGQPTVIIAQTIKGKGVSFMENNADFHGKAPSPEQVELALKELE